MLSKEEIEKAKERIQNSLNDVWFGVLYSQEERDEDEKILLQYIQELETSNEELDKENNRLEKIEFERDMANKIIDEMSKQLAGIAIWNNEKEEPLILGDKEEAKQYFEKKVEEK